MFVFTRNLLQLTPICPTLLSSDVLSGRPTWRVLGMASCAGSLKGVMQHLIFAVSSILLIAAVSLAGMFFGGSTFFDNSSRTVYTKAVNGGAQIEEIGRASCRERVCQYV